MDSLGTSMMPSRCPHWMNGVELLGDALKNKCILPTGCEGIDTLLGGGLREGQLTELVGPSSSGKTQEQEKTIMKIMSSIHCQSIFDVFSLQDALYELESKLKIIREDTKICMLIVDSISSLITPVLGNKNLQGHSLMVSIGYLMKKLADEWNLSVLVTNHMVGAERGTSKPAMGESWKCIPHVRLQLSRNPGSSICNISVLRHTSMASGRSAEFLIPN